MATNRVYNIAVIPGDGIGKEVVPEGVRVLEAAAKKFGFELRQDNFDFASYDYYAKHERMMPEDWKDQIGKHDAIFFGAGLGADTSLGIPGEDLANVFGAVEWIEQLKTSRVTTEGVKHCVIVGGGNTALDCLREARGLGIERVTMLYRRIETQMSGYIHEWKAAEMAGCRVEWQSLPTAFEGQGRVERVQCQRVDKTSFTLDAELVLVAIGQSKLGALLGSLAGIRIDKGRVVTDDSGFTGRPKWFAGGDCANGGKEVVNGAAEGKTAARAIHEFLARSR